MGPVVLKFGGTSLNSASARQAAIRHIADAKNRGNRVAVIVSAMGRRGEPYATDTLLALLETIDSRIDARKKDLLLSCGEIISAVLISHMLESIGIASVPLSGFQAGIITDGKYTDATIIDVKTEPIIRCLEEDKVAVIAGFQGYSRNLEITTLGRGGSDISAIVIGGYIGADTIDIFTDVPGVAVTDPRIIPESPFIKLLSREHMYRLSKHGAKVVHPRAVKAAIDFKTPFRVRSTFSQDPGTLIDSETHCLSDRGLIGIASEDGMNLISLVFSKSEAREMEEEVCTLLSDKGVVPLGIFYEPYTLLLALNQEDKQKAVRIIYDGFFCNYKRVNTAG
ncbi:MAG: Aspartokinase [Firmicutes bacterium]|nr:Aspartokinase [Bacillota bacterium]